VGSLHCVRTCTQKKSFLGFHFKEPHAEIFSDASIEGHHAEDYVASATHHAPATTPVHVVPHHTSVPHTTHETVPYNLPIGEPIVGYGTHSEHDHVVHTETTESKDELSELENQAHAQKVLLSSDAMRYFVAHITNIEERVLQLDAVIKKARATYPSEDGWVVLNLQKMEYILEDVLRLVNTELENSVTYTPMTAGSLAEAIMLKDTALAFMLASDRPMIALADAVSDLNAVCAHKKGEQVTVSNFLIEQTELLSQDTLEEVLKALTTAIDGTYSEEEQAVKMAITKAIAVLPH
jgi:hypothetical protein